MFVNITSFQMFSIVTLFLNLFSAMKSFHFEIFLFLEYFVSYLDASHDRLFILGSILLYKWIWDKTAVFCTGQNSRLSERD